MSAIVINNVEYSLPVDFSLSQWKHLTSTLDKPKQLIADAFGCELVDLEEMDDEQIHLGSLIVYRMLYPDHIEPKTDDLKSFKELTIGEFIDLEVYIGQTAAKTIVDIANVLYEEEITENTLISDIWGAFQSYMNYRKLLFKQYDGLFGGDDDLDEVIKDKPFNPLDNARSWYNTIMYCANDDLIKANQITDRPVVEVFNYLAYRKTKMMEEYQRAKRQQLESKTR